MLRIILLGGGGEIGKSMIVVEDERSIIVIDAGLMFPDEDMPGIDLVLPDFSYLIKNRRKVKAIFLTHGHEDHTGALPYVLKEINVPVYGTRLTLGLAKQKLDEHRLLPHVTLHEIDPSKSVTVDSFKLSFMRVNHSVPDGVGIAIETPQGLVVHSGDFKLDQTPMDGKLTELDKFVALGQRGVLVFLSDSTNAEIPGYTPTERTVGRALDSVFKIAKQRIVVACFSSHIHRIQQIINVAYENRRKVAISGRSIRDSVSIASELGYLHIPPQTMIGLHEISEYPPNKIVILATGSQGEPMSTLARLASHDHKHITLIPGDTVILSATPVPGNEKSVSRTIDQLFKIGARVYYEEESGVHVSGHAAQEELTLMLNLVHPKYFIPIHGEYRQLMHHAGLAENIGIPADNILIAENGDVLKFSNGKGEKHGKVSAGAMFVDGLGVGDIGDVVLRDRRRLSKDGVFIVVAAINRQNSEILAGPDVISRGFIYPQEIEGLIEESKVRVREALDLCAEEGIVDDALLKSHIRDSLRRYLYEKTRRRPMVMTVLIEL